MISALLHKLTGRQHHFKIVLRFYPDRRAGDFHIERKINICMPDRRLITDERALRKQFASSMIDQIPRNRLRNGGIDVAEVYYLGWFRPKEQ